MFDSALNSFTAIVIALIGGGFSVYAAKIAKGNRRDTSKLTKVLNNTSNVESLDQVILTLQRQLHDQELFWKEREKIMQKQINTMGVEIKDLKAANQELLRMTRG